MNKKTSISKEIRRKAYLMSLIVGLLAFLVLFQYQKNQVIESSDAIKVRSGDSIISPEVASAIALNSFKEIENGITLSHPNHSVNFEKEGVFFQPKKGPEWQWHVTHIGTEAKPLDALPLHEVIPENKNPRIVSYEYGNITEEYHAKQNTVEQRFVLDSPLPLDGQNLVIKGEVTTEGQFEELDQGWAWSDSEGQVKLGDVTVFDAKGQILMASMNVTAQSTEIIVDAHALATATYPVTVDPEIGANDFRISNTGPDGEEQFDATDPAIAYSSTNEEYLVVWSGLKDSISGFTEYEIFGQRIDAKTGNEIGTDFRISDMGADGSLLFTAMTPAVAYSLANNSYLVVWSGNETVGESEIYGQLLDASTGAEIGANDFRISDMGPNGDPAFDALVPAIDYNSTEDEYLVVWTGNETVDTAGENEVYGQLLDASTGAEIGVNDFRISDMGPDGDSSFWAAEPAIAYNSNDNNYLVVWMGIDDTPPLKADELEIFGQQIDSTGGEIGVNDFRVSHMGPDENPFQFLFPAHLPDVVHNPKRNEYMVVWHGSDAGSVITGNDIFAQRLDGSTGSEIGSDFQISQTLATSPSIVYNSITDEYLVSFEGHNTDFELEIFVQRLDSNGIEVGPDDFRISDMGPDGSDLYEASKSAIAFNFTNNEYLVVWHGDDDTPPLVDEKFEIFGQIVTDKDLYKDASQISLSSGGTLNLKMNFGPDCAGFPYLVLGTLSGTTPGSEFDGKPIPLNPDAYTFATLTEPNSQIHSSVGTLGPQGQATAKVFFPADSDSSLAGMTAHYIALVFDPLIIGGLLKVSCPASLDLDP